MANTQLIPLSNRFVSIHQRIPAGTLLGIVPKPARTFVRTVLPFASFFTRIPDLNLRGAAHVNTAVRVGIETKIDKEFHIPIIFLRAQIRPMAIIVNHPIFDLPMHGEDLEILLALSGNLLGIPEFDVVMGILRAPSTEVLTIK